MLVLVPLYVLDSGVGAAFAAVLLGLRGIGMLLFDLPVGILLVRLGDKPVLLIGLAAMGVSTVLFALSAAPWIMGIADVRIAPADMGVDHTVLAFEHLEQPIGVRGVGFEIRAVRQ